MDGGVEGDTRKKKSGGVLGVKLTRTNIKTKTEHSWIKPMDHPWSERNLRAGGRPSSFSSLLVRELIVLVSTGGSQQPESVDDEVGEEGGGLERHQARGRIGEVVLAAEREMRPAAQHHQQQRRQKQQGGTPVQLLAAGYRWFFCVNGPYSRAGMRSMKSLRGESRK